jgi:Flp pilus assembly protein TadD
VATLLAYVPAMLGGYIWDDDAFVTDNPVLRTANGLWRIWFEFRATDQYYPMAYTSFWLEYQFWGYWATGSHVVNVLLHILNALLLWRVLLRLRVPGAWFAAFVFALHPVEVESVAWITERKNVLSATFYLLAALAWFRFQPLPGNPNPETGNVKPEKVKGVRSEPVEKARDWRLYPLVALLFLCALWTKTTACSLPAALLLVLWWKQERVRWREALPLAPLFVIGAGMGLLTSWMEKHVIGAKGNDWSLTLAERFLIAGRALWFYAGKLAWPEPLIFFYPRWRLDAGAWWQWLYPAAAALLAACLWLARGKTGKAPLAAAGFFALTLFPALGFIDVYPFRYSFVADHFQYLASIGLIALAAGMARGLHYFAKAPLPRIALCAVLLTALGALTWRQGWMYRDVETLYRTAIERNPECWMAQDNLAFCLMQAGKVDESIVHSRRALEIKPDDAEAHVNLGNALLAKGDKAAARTLYERALQIRPDFAEAYSNLGNVLLFQQHMEEAMRCYRRALQIRPKYAEAWNNLGYTLLQLGKTDEAIPRFRKALEIKPDYGQARVNLQDALARKER